jgi:hypothetical protein
MRVAHSALLVVVLLAGGAQAFTSPFGVMSKARRCTAAFMSEAVAEVVETEEAVETAPSAPAPTSEPALSGLRMKDVRKTIAKLTKDNFQQSLDTIEPFLLNEAGASLYSKSIRRLDGKAKELGVEVPAGYAKEAKATAKKREKQAAFIAQKEEERMAAEVEAAQAEAAEAEAAAAAEAEGAPEVEAAAEEETVEEAEPVEA